MRPGRLLGTPGARMLKAMLGVGALCLGLAAAAATPVVAQTVPQTAPQRPPPSLFFTPDEVAVLDAAIRARMLPQPHAAPAARTPEGPAVRVLRLGAIIRFGADRWTVWLNGERVTPGNLPDQIRAISVFDDMVRMDWFDQRRGTSVRVELRPYHEMLLDSGEVRRFDPSAAVGATIR